MKANTVTSVPIDHATWQDNYISYYQKSSVPTVYTASLSNSTSRFTVYLNNTVVTRCNSEVVKPKYPSRVQHKRAPRGKVDGFTKASRDRLEQLCEDCRFSTVVTLSYSNECLPMDNAEFREHRSKLIDKLVYKKYRGIAVCEWRCEDGRPHLHLLVEPRIDIYTIGKMWAKVLRSDLFANRIDIEDIRSRRHQNEVASYYSKYNQKKAPEDMGPTKRIWVTFGCLKKEIICVVEGPARELAPAIRAMREEKKRRRVRKKAGHTRKRDTGVSKMTFKDSSAVALEILDRFKPSLEGKES